MRRLVSGGLLALAASAGHAQGRTYLLSCETAIKAPPPGATTLHSVQEVSALHFGPGDVLLVARGSVCKGVLLLQGSGTAAQPIAVRAFGEGPLPQMRAGEGAEQAVELRDGSHWQITELDIQGGTRRGLFVTATRGTVEDVVLRDLHVHDVYGPLRHKDEGLVVVEPSAGAGFHHLTIDGIRAEGTTLWSGIFVSGADGEVHTSDVVLENSIAHDVQGDGVVLFNLNDGTIRNTTAWHTGMQHSYTIGTPNGIWTWHCNRCTVEGSEAFLTDSPGVDGGAFDIDFGNSGNRVLGNFGHDTQGYCVSIFGAFGPTTDSEVAHNTCINNGLSPRLAERQGALLLMTWSGGRIESAFVHDNTIVWRPAGNTPAIQAGQDLQARAVRFENNYLETDVSTPIAPGLARFNVSRASSFSPDNGAQSKEIEAPGRPAPAQKGHTLHPVQLSISVGPDTPPEALRTLLQRAATLAVQFSPQRLAVSVGVPFCNRALHELAEDWASDNTSERANLGIRRSPCGAQASPVWRIHTGQQTRSLPQNADRALLWNAAVARVGQPDFSPLTFVPILAHD